MANLHLLAKTYGKLPSKIIGVSNTWAAYQFDMAVLLAGMDFESRALEEQTGSGNRNTGKPPKRKTSYQSIRNSGLSRTGVRKMQVPESGIW
jgi:hypothetical protein